MSHISNDFMEAFTISKSQNYLAYKPNSPGALTARASLTGDSSMGVTTSVISGILSVECLKQLS